MTTMIIVTGPPASGKTTIARELAGQLALPLIEKDRLKERLANLLEVEGDEWSARLGAAAYDLAFEQIGRLLAANVSCILEGNFHPEYANHQLQMLSAGAEIIQVVCTAQPAELLGRYRRRWLSGTRHPIHRDGLQLQNENFLAQLERSFDLDVAAATVSASTNRCDTCTIEWVVERVGALMKTEH